MYFVFKVVVKMTGVPWTLLSENSSMPGMYAQNLMASLFFFLFFFCLFRAEPAAYGGSQARGQIGAVAAGLRHSHSSLGFELHF